MSVRRSVSIRRSLSIHRKSREDANSLTTITDEHLIPIITLCQRLKTSSTHGIEESAVKQILKKQGKNKIYRPKRPLSSELKDLFNWSDSPKEGFSKAEWDRLFGNRIPKEASVIRSGNIKVVSGEDIVVGDLVELHEQSVAPADIRLTWSDNVIVDNRLITGRPKENRTHRTKFATKDCLLSPNIIFAGTRIIRGRCLGIVLRTGENTVFASLKNHARKVVIAKPKRRLSTGGTLTQF